MPIIINDFEIVSPPSGQSQGAADNRTNTENAKASQQRENELRPEDIERILRRFVQRRRRIWAD